MEILDLQSLAERYHCPAESTAAISIGARCREDFMERFLAHCGGLAGKSRWGDKTPMNVHYFGRLLTAFPRSKVIHVVRDGRDVVCSLRTHPRFGLREGKREATGVVQSLKACVARWKNDVSAGLAWRGVPGYLEVRYENLVLDTEKVVRWLLSELGEQYDPACLTHSEQSGPLRDAAFFPQNPEAMLPVYQHAVGRWRHDLTAEEACYVERELWPLLHELGYV